MTTTTTDYATLLADAHAAGYYAMTARASTITPMTVRDPRTGETWTVPGGPCGFAWVVLRPATTPFARWLKRERFNADRSVNVAEGGSWSKHYGGGYNFWVWEGGQSLEMKAAYAKGYAQVLKDAGYDAYAQSRMD